MNRRTKISIAAAAGSVGLLALTAIGCGTVRSGYDTAPYKVDKKDGAIEIRDYADLKLVSTDMKTAEGKADDRAFMRLFKYIGGANTDQAKIAMTTPVFMRESADKEQMTMSFVLPAGTTVAPSPAAKELRLEESTARRVAAIRFSGRANEETLAKQTALLRAWLLANNLTALNTTPWIAQYDPPWTPGPLRRNEVLIEIPSTK